MTSTIIGGYLELILGPMFSGKTTRLIDIYNSLYADNKNIKVINYTGDTRYHDSMLSTHDKVMIPCVFANKIQDVCQPDNIHTYDIILINEGQFFPDIVEWTKIVIGHPHNKRVYICGLDGDFKRNVFGNWLDLIAYSDTVQKLTSICLDCRDEPAIFIHRMTCEMQQKVIGSESYIPLCRSCYEKRCV